MSYSGRHLGFHTLKMIRKNDTLIFLKAYDVFFQNQVSFCFYQKKKHEITNEPTLLSVLLVFANIDRRLNQIILEG